MNNDQRQAGNEKGVTEIEVTPEMAEAGGVAFGYFSTHSDEPSNAVIAGSIFRVMMAVASGAVSVAQVTENAGPNRGYPFFEKRFSASSDPR